MEQQIFGRRVSSIKMSENMGNSCHLCHEKGFSKQIICHVMLAFFIETIQKVTCTETDIMADQMIVQLVLYGYAVFCSNSNLM